MKEFIKKIPFLGPLGHSIYRKVRRSDALDALKHDVQRLSTQLTHVEREKRGLALDLVQAKQEKISLSSRLDQFERKEKGTGFAPLKKQPDWAVCTITAKDYLAKVRVLSKSFHHHHPDVDLFVLIIDDFDGYLTPNQESFHVVRLQELMIEDVSSLCFKYDVQELCWAVKPFFLEHLFERYHFKKLIFLDSDIQVFNPLSPLIELLSQNAILLTPHTTEPLADSSALNERTLLVAGTYSLGFLGLSNVEETRRMLIWLKERCYDYCFNRPQDGLCGDQAWMDLAVGMFKGVHIVTGPEYHVAHWNLPSRKITFTPEPRVNGSPLLFFHFSGYEPTLPERLSKHNTLLMNDIGEARKLFDRYRELLLKEGYLEYVRWPYSYSHFDNGVLISPVLRYLYERLVPQRRALGNPFSTRHTGSFFEWLNAPANGQRREKPYVSNLIDFLSHTYIPQHRPDIAQAFIRGSLDRKGFEDWLLSTAPKEMNLDSVFLEPLR